MRVVRAQDTLESRPKGQAAIEASVKLLEWIAADGLKTTHPDFSEIAMALSSQGAFADLELHVKCGQFEVRLRGLSLGGQKGAAERSPLLADGFEQLNAMRKEARDFVRAARPPSEFARGSKLWYQQELAERDQEIQKLIDQQSFLTSAVEAYMACARRYATAAGMGKEFDRFQVGLLKKYGPVRKPSV